MYQELVNIKIIIKIEIFNNISDGDFFFLVKYALMTYNAR
jgi:hypothetical protein